MIQISVKNVDSSDLFVTLTDNNTQPPTSVLVSQRMNSGGPPVETQIQEDGSGAGSVTWNAARCNDPSIAHQQTEAPFNLGTVEVFAA